MELLMVFAGPSIGIAMRVRIVSEVREPRILQRRVIKLPRRALIMMFEARNTYFEVCNS
jgi:hypothetical protein